MLGSHVAAWNALRKALGELVADADARSNAVIDESNDIWCAWPPTQEVVDAAEVFYRQEISNRRGTLLRRGGRLSLVRPRPAPAASYLAESFAGIYVLVVWFEGMFDPFKARTCVRAALPRIESLTLALPPPEGPAGGEAAGRQRA